MFWCCCKCSCPSSCQSVPVRVFWSKLYELIGAFDFAVLHPHHKSWKELPQISSSQHALLLTVLGEQMLKWRVIWCVLLNINIQEDLVVFNGLVFRNIKGFVVYFWSFWGYHCAEELSLWFGWWVFEVKVCIHYFIKYICELFYTGIFTLSHTYIYSSVL